MVRPAITVSLLPSGIHLMHYAGLKEPYEFDALLDEYPPDKYNWVYLNTKLQLDYLHMTCAYTELDEADVVV